MSPSIVSVEVEDDAWTADVPDAAALAEEAARATLQAEADQNEAELTVLLTGDEAVRALNARFRAIDRPTNVLSFPAAGTARPHLGDIALAYGVCADEARAQHKPLGDHLMHLVVHGVLHLVGYDHEADSDAVVMEDKERAILRGLGAPDPYETRPHHA